MCWKPYRSASTKPAGHAEASSEGCHRDGAARACLQPHPRDEHCGHSPADGRDQGIVQVRENARVATSSSSDLLQENVLTRPRPVAVISRIEIPQCSEGPTVERTGPRPLLTGFRELVILPCVVPAGGKSDAIRPIETARVHHAARRRCRRVAARGKCAAAGGMRRVSLILPLVEDDLEAQSRVRAFRLQLGAAPEAISQAAYPELARTLKT
jgi:hypothetical protein